MADDASNVHIGENSPEQIAYKLLQIIASIEEKSLVSSMASKATANRKWLLDSYAECLRTVRSPAGRK
jgi:hypothetical protein